MVNREAGSTFGALSQVFQEGTVAGLTDAQLLERYALRGDAAAFEALLIRYGPLVLGVCRRRLRDGHAAEDAFQATFLILVRKANSIRCDRSLGPWIHGVAWRVAERLRVEASRRRVHEASDALAEDLPAPTDLEGQRRELAEELDRELLRLPEKYRAPIVLCHLEGLTHHEAAQRLGCPSGTVSIRLVRAYARLRERLARRGTTPAAASMTHALSVGGLATASVPPALFERVLRTSIGKVAVSPVVAELIRGTLRETMRTKILQTVVIGLASFGLAGALTTAALAYLQQAPQAALVLKGRVVDDRDRPIPGAEVWLPLRFDPNADEAHAVADADGCFALPVDDRLTRDEMRISMATIWAYAPGHSIGTGGTYKFLKGIDRSEIVVRLGPSTDTAFTVIGPDDRPVAGARVEPYHLMAPNRAYDFPAEGLLKVVGGITDARGHVRLPTVDRQGFSSVSVASSAFGQQTLRITDKADEPADRTVRLRPSGRFEGRIVADRPELARGVELYFTTEQELQIGGWVTEGHARIVTDDQGRFIVPALASGLLRIDGGVDSAIPFRLRFPERFTILAGEISRLELPLQPAVKVRGIVRSDDSKQPLAGASVSVGYGTFRQSDQVTTGPDGKFEALVIPGPVRLQVIVTPTGYIQVGAPWAEPVEVPADRGEFALPPIDLIKTRPPIVGMLVDGRDRPLASIQIFAISGNRRYGFGQSDATGSFSFEGIPPDIELQYEVWSDEENTVPAEVVREKPLTLRVRLKREMIEAAGDKAAVTARVVDREGKPVVGSGLVLVQTTYGPAGQFQGRKYDRFGTTDAEGKCRKAFAPAKGTTYHVVVQPGVSNVAAGEPILFDGQGPLDFPPIVVDRFAEVSGVVEDDQGRPIAGATVLNRGNASPWTSSTAGPEGKFRLGGLPNGEAFLFAEAPGFRFHGSRVSTRSAEPVRIVLTRKDGPAAKSIGGLPPAIPRELAAELALKLVAPDRERILSGPDRNAQSDLFAVLARVDPEAAWTKIRTGDKTWDRDSARLAVFHAFSRTDPTTARAVLALVKSPFYRISGLEELYDAMPAEPIEPKKAFLRAAIAEARSPAAKDFQVYFFKHFGRRLSDLGEADEVRAMVEEVMGRAKAADAGIGRPEAIQSLAEILGRFDPEAAEALIPKDGDERGRNDVRGAVAEGVAILDPASAERLIGAFTHQSSEVFSVHTCQRMARSDLPRARWLASRIKSEALRGYAFGLMADALATSDPAAAKGLLDDSSRAFVESALRGQGGVWSSHSAAVMAASLLPVVERVSPDRLEEFVRRAVSLRWEPRAFNDLMNTIPDSSSTDRLNQAAALAQYLARYDRDLARVVLEPAIEAFFKLPEGSKVEWLQWRLILSALTQIDPLRAVDLARVVPNATESDGRGIGEAARLIIARSLLETPEEISARTRSQIIDLEILLREDR